MLSIILVLLIIFAILCMIITMNEKDPLWALISSVFWFICSLGVMNIDIPYQLYNSSSSMIETGVQTIDAEWEIGLLFMMLALVMFLSFVCLSFDITLQKLIGRKR